MELEEKEIQYYLDEPRIPELEFELRNVPEKIEDAIELLVHYVSTKIFHRIEDKYLDDIYEYLTGKERDYFLNLLELHKIPEVQFRHEGMDNAYEIEEYVEVYRTMDFDKVPTFLNKEVYLATIEKYKNCEEYLNYKEIPKKERPGKMRTEILDGVFARLANYEHHEFFRPYLCKELETGMKLNLSPLELAYFKYRMEKIGYKESYLIDNNVGENVLEWYAQWRNDSYHELIQDPTDESHEYCPGYNDWSDEIIEKYYDGEY